MSSRTTPKTAYTHLLKQHWDEAPGVPSQRYQASADALTGYLERPDAVDNAAVALGFMANDELLVAGNLIAANRAEEAWAWMDRAQAYAFLSHRIYSCAAWIPSGYTASIFNMGAFCAYFALALARGDEEQVRWYAQQIYNLRRGGLGDASCPAPEYLEFYWELAIAALARAWPEPQVLADELGPYALLMRPQSGETALQAALLACADHHLDLAVITSPRNEDEAAHPLRSLHIGHLPYELVAWRALYQRLSGHEAPWIDHPFMPRGLKVLVAQAAVDDARLMRLEKLAAAAYGAAWEAPLRSYDELWPEA